MKDKIYAKGATVYYQFKDYGTNFTYGKAYNVIRMFPKDLSRMLVKNDLGENEWMNVNHFSDRPLENVSPQTGNTYPGKKWIVMGQRIHGYEVEPLGYTYAHSMPQALKKAKRMLKGKAVGIYVERVSEVS